MQIQKLRPEELTKLVGKPGTLYYTDIDGVVTHYLWNAGAFNPAAGFTTEQVPALRAVVSRDGNLSGGSNALCAVVGDSIMQDSFITVVGANATTKTFSQWGSLAWLRRKLGLGLTIDFDRVFATAGHTLAQIRDIQLPLLIASDAQRCIMNGGVNSITGGVSYADCVSALTTILDGAQEAGIFVDYLGFRACASGNITDAQARQGERLNRWLAARAKAHPRAMRFHDWNALYLDLSTGYAKSTYLRDGKHDNSVSAYAAGAWLAARLGSQVLPTMGGVGDVYNATDNPWGNGATNPKLTGTGGSTTNGATGTVASNWSLYRTANSGTVTVAGSLESDDVYSGAQRQVITFGGTADGNTAQFQQTQAIPGSFAVGDRVMARCVLDVAIPAGFQDLCVYLASRDSSFVKYGGEGYDGADVATNGALPAISETGLVYETQPFVIGAGSTVLDFFVRAKTPASGSLTATIKIKAIEIRKLPS